MYIKILKISILIIFSTIILLSGCNNRNSDYKEIDIGNTISKIMSEINFPEMVEINKDEYKDYYSFNDNFIDGKLLVNASGGFPDEIIILKSKSNKDSKEIKKSLEKRKEDLIKTFVNYQPKEMYKLEDSVILDKQDYIMFIVCDNSEKAKQIFMEQFK